MLEEEDEKKYTIVQSPVDSDDEDGDIPGPSKKRSRLENEILSSFPVQMQRNHDFSGCWQTHSSVAYPEQQREDLVADMEQNAEFRSANEVVTILHLPDEVLCKILCQIGNIKNRIKLQFVCRRIRQVAAEICWSSMPLLAIHIHSVEERTNKPKCIGLSDCPHPIAPEKLSETVTKELNCQVCSSGARWKTAVDAVEFIWKRARQLRGLQLAFDERPSTAPQDTIGFLLREISRLQAKFPRDIRRLDLQGYFVESPTSFTLLTIWSSRIREVSLVWDSGEAQSDKEMDCVMNTVSLCGDLRKLCMTGNLRAPKHYDLCKALTIAFEGKENLRELNLNGFPVNNKEFPLSGKDLAKALLTLDVTERPGDLDFKLTMPLVKPEFLMDFADFLENENRERETFCDYVSSFRVRYSSTRRLVFKDFKRYFDLFPCLTYCELEPSLLQKFNNPGFVEVAQNFVQTYKSSKGRRILMIRLPKSASVRSTIRDTGGEMAKRLMKMSGQCTARCFEYKKLPHFKFIKGSAMVKLGSVFPSDFATVEG